MQEEGVSLPPSIYVMGSSWDVEYKFSMNHHPPSLIYLDQKFAQHKYVIYVPSVIAAAVGLLNFGFLALGWGGGTMSGGGIFSSSSFF